jgi:hypothetical protein
MFSQITDNDGTSIIPQFHFLDSGAPLLGEPRHLSSLIGRAWIQNLDIEDHWRMYVEPLLLLFWSGYDTAVLLVGPQGPLDMYYSEEISSPGPDQPPSG